MAKVEIGEYRAQDAHYGFYRDDLPSGDVILIRRKVGEPTDYLHPNSRKVRQQRLNFGLASTHYSHLTPIQKRELRYVVEEVPFVRGHSKSGTKVLQGRTLFIAKDIHSLNELQRHIPSYLQICIALTDQDLNLIEGDIRLYGLIDSEWREEDRKQLSPSHWLFPTGNLYFHIYRVSDNYIIQSELWGSATTLPQTPTWIEVEFDDPPAINEEVRICAYFAGGSAGKVIYFYRQYTDVKAGEYYTKAFDLVWTDVPAADAAYRYTYLDMEHGETIIDPAKSKLGLIHVKHPALLSGEHRRDGKLLNEWTNLSSLDEEYLTGQVGIDVFPGDELKFATIAGVEYAFRVP